MTTYTLRKGSPARTRTDLVVVGVQRTSATKLRVAPGGEDVAGAYGRRFEPLMSSLGFHGEVGEVLRVPAEPLRASQLLLVGLGSAPTTPDVLRQAAGTAARNLGNVSSVALALPAEDPADIGAVVEGFVSGLYAFTEFKSRSDDTSVAEVAVLSEAARRQDSVAALEEARTVAALVDEARTWVNTPPNALTPEVFADRVVELVARRAGKGATLDVEVMDVDRLRELQCGGILGVGQGSANEPRLVKLAWAPEDAVASVSLVGKGITYDSGGLTIKPGASMATMKYDMGGAAAVLAATIAVAELGLPVAVTAYAPMAENMPGGAAMRPGDVLTMHSGKTVEVTNTDAEGRLVMADALTMAVHDEPDAIIDVATLTGACILALGERIAGVFGDDATTAAVLDASKVSGEPFWRLPIPEPTREAVRTESKIADVLQHNWVRWGSASYAAAFLEQFVEGRPWAHLDIAGPAWNSGSPLGHLPAGGTGFGVTTLVAYVRALAAGAAAQD